MYYLIFFTLVFFSLIGFFLPRKVNNFLLFICFISLLLFAGLRLNVGFDYDNYKIVFTDISYNAEYFIEPVFLLFTRIFQTITFDYNAYLFVIALISLSLKFRFLYKYSVLPLVAVLLYYSRIYLGSDFGQIRQGIALGVILLTFPYLVKKKFYKFCILVILATLIHVSAILFFPIYFIVHKVYSKKIIFVSIIVGLVASLIDMKPILLESFSSILPAGLAFKLFIYATTEENIGLTFSVFFRLFIIIYTVFFFWDKIENYQNFKIAFNIYYIGFLFYLVFNSLPQLGGRGSIYFQQFELILLPFLIYYNKNKIMKFGIFMFLLFYSFWGVRTILDSATIETPYFFEPYENVLNNILYL